MADSPIVCRRTTAVDNLLLLHRCASRRSKRSRAGAIVQFQSRILERAGYAEAGQPGPIPRTITLVAWPEMMKPPIITLSPVWTRPRV